MKTRQPSPAGDGTASNAANLSVNRMRESKSTRAAQPGCLNCALGALNTLCLFSQAYRRFNHPRALAQGDGYPRPALAGRPIGRHRYLEILDASQVLDDSRAITAPHVDSVQEVKPSAHMVCGSSNLLTTIVDPSTFGNCYTSGSARPRQSLFLGRPMINLARIRVNQREPRGRTTASEVDFPSTVVTDAPVTTCGAICGVQGPRAARLQNLLHKS